MTPVLPIRFLRGLTAVLVLAFALATPALGTSSPATGGSPDNSASGREVLLRDILPDLRVFVDMVPGQRPWNRLDGELPDSEVREAVRLGVGNWASVLPGMRFRLVDSPAEANLVFRFRDYKTHVPGGATAVAFLPGAWKAPGPDGPDFSCGAAAFGRNTKDQPCDETAENMILFQNRGIGFRRVHFLDPRRHQDYLLAKSDRRDPRKKYFRKLPDPRYGVWPPDLSTCIAGARTGGVLPAWDAVCLTAADWEALPDYDRWGPVEGPYDIASMVQHELGHALLGDHTGNSASCQSLSSTDFEDFKRDPVYTGSPIRLLEWKTFDGGKATGYSTLFTGNGIDAAFNIRGVFEADGMRLASGVLDWACKPYGAWKGYGTSYPKVNGWIVLMKPTGETKYVDDWRYAHRLMRWPVAGGAPAAAEWYQTGIILK